MGLFDIFSGKKRRENQKMLEAIKSMAQGMQEMREGAVDTDDLPKGYGPYGRVVTNPILTASIPSSKAYLAALQTKDG